MKPFKNFSPLRIKIFKTFQINKIFHQCENLQIKLLKVITSFFNFKSFIVFDSQSSRTSPFYTYNFSTANCKRHIKSRICMDYDNLWKCFWLPKEVLRVCEARMLETIKCYKSRMKAICKMFTQPSTLHTWNETRCFQLHLRDVLKFSSPTFHRVLQSKFITRSRGASSSLRD